MRQALAAMGEHRTLRWVTLPGFHYALAKHRGIPYVRSLTRMHADRRRISVGHRADSAPTSVLMSLGIRQRPVSLQA